MQGNIPWSLFDAAQLSALVQPFFSASPPSSYIYTGRKRRESRGERRYMHVFTLITIEKQVCINIGFIYGREKVKKQGEGGVNRTVGRK